MSCRVDLSVLNRATDDIYQVAGLASKLRKRFVAAVTAILGVDGFPHGIAHAPTGKAMLANGAAPIHHFEVRCHAMKPIVNKWYGAKFYEVRTLDKEAQHNRHEANHKQSKEA